MSAPSKNAVEAWKDAQIASLNESMVEPEWVIQRAIDAATKELKAQCAQMLDDFAETDELLKEAEAKCAELQIQLDEQKVATEMANHACESKDAQCAAMRDFFEALRNTHDLDVPEDVWNEIQDAGQNFVHIDDVKPLLEAIEHLSDGDYNHVAGDFLAKHGEKIK